MNFLVFAAVFAVMLSGVVSAYAYFDVRMFTDSVVQGFIDIFEPVLRALFGGTYWDSTLLFEKLLIFVLFISLISISFSRIPWFEGQSKTIQWIVAFVVALLGVRYMEYDWITTIILQYQVLAIALTSVLPFVIFFFFVYSIGDNYPLLRKAFWGLFALVYLGLWSSVDAEFNAIYFWTLVTSIVFMFMDSTIARFYRFQQLKSRNALNKHTEVGRIRSDIALIHEQMRNNFIDQKIGKKLIKEKEKLINWILKDI